MLYEPLKKLINIKKGNNKKLQFNKLTINPISENKPIEGGVGLLQQHIKNHKKELRGLKLPKPFHNKIERLLIRL